MKSTEKVRQALDELVAQIPELQGNASGMDAIVLAGAAHFAPGLARMVAERIPTDPAALDELLTGAARFIVDLRSDPTGVTVLDDGEVLPDVFGPAIVIDTAAVPTVDAEAAS